MKSKNELFQIIKSGLETIIDAYCESNYIDLDHDIAMERSFEERRDDHEELFPRDETETNKLYVTIAFGRGEMNFDVSSTPITITMVSEQNMIGHALAIMNQYVAAYQYQYKNGVVQSYFTPSVSSPINEVHAGYRAMIETQGKIVDFFDLACIVTSIEVDNVAIPFVNFTWNYTASPDPRPFPDSSLTATGNGTNFSLNQHNVISFTINTYLWNINLNESDVPTSAIGKYTFAKKVIHALREDINEKFHFVLKLNDGTTFADDWYVLSGFTLNQTIGTPSVVPISFAKAKETEDV